MDYTKHGVVRTDLVAGTDQRAALVSIKYMGEDGATPTEIDNGNVLKVGSLMEGEREIFTGEVPSSDSAIKEIVLIATPELMYDERLHNLDQFYNQADVPCRGYRLNPGNIFSLTAEALEGTPAVGESVALSDGTKLEVGGSGTEVGTIIEEEIVGRYTYYAIQVN